VKISSETGAIGNLAPSLMSLTLSTRFPIRSAIDSLGEHLKQLRSDIYFYAEFPYVERVFRDTYYSYFSTKKSSYIRECVRIALFDEPVRKNDFFDPESIERLRREGNFLGFITLRPTKRKHIGRSVLSPDSFETNSFSCCETKFSVTINGIDLQVFGFPHQSQDGESMSCAEVTLWSTAEYFGHKYSEYRTVLPSDLVKILRSRSYERQLPTKGLYGHQISYALKKLGFGVKIYSRKGNLLDFDKIVDTYVESGIPIIALIDTPKSGHVYLLIGHDRTMTETDPIVKEEIELYNGRKIVVTDSADLYKGQKRYVTIDDNMPPYRLIDIDNPVSSYLEGGFDGKRFDTSTAEGKKKQQNCEINWLSSSINGVVVPLYGKVYLDAKLARRIVISLLKSKEIGYSCDESEIVLRLLLTSSRSFKRKFSLEKKSVHKKIILTQMPKFIWIAELSTAKLFKSKTKQAFGMIVLDATEASSSYLDSLLFILYPDKWYYRGKDGNLIPDNVVIRPFPVYSNFKTKK